MAKYTTRTCTSCGIRKPQPEMVQKEIYAETGKSKAGVSGSTFIGMMLDDKKSQNAVNRWLFNTNQRTYKRKKNVWLCGNCSKKVNNEDDGILGILFLIAVVVILFLVFSS
jgi:hypothetical protein